MRYYVLIDCLGGMGKNTLIEESVEHYSDDAARAIAKRAWKTVVEEKSASRVVDSLSENQKVIYNETIEKLAKGDTSGLNVHDLTGNKKGLTSADLKGFGRGRGNARIYYTEENGKIIIKEIDLAHQ